MFFKEIIAFAPETFMTILSLKICILRVISFQISFVKTQVANVKVKEIIRACKRSIEDEDMDFGNSTSEELLAKIENMTEESADLSKSGVYKFSFLSE